MNLKVGLILDLHNKGSAIKCKALKDYIDFADMVFQKNKVEEVFNLGDTNEKAILSSYHEFSFLTHYLKVFGKYRNWVLEGNHEIIKISEKDYSIWEIVNLVSNPRWRIIIEYEEHKFGEVTMGFLPYGDFRNVMSDLVTQHLDYLFHHKDVQGMSYASGHVIDSDSALNFEKYPIAKAAYGGHLHLYQRKGVNTYVGSGCYKNSDYIFNYTRELLPHVAVLDMETNLLDRTIVPFGRVNLRYTDKVEVPKIIEDLQDIFSIKDNSYEVYIRFVYSLGDYDCESVKQRVMNFSKGHNVKIEFFRINKPSLSLAMQGKTDKVEGADKVMQKSGMSKEESEGVEKAIIDCLEKKNPDLIKIYKRLTAEKENDFVTS